MTVSGGRQWRESSRRVAVTAVSASLALLRHSGEWETKATHQPCVWRMRRTKARGGVYGAVRREQDIVSGRRDELGVCVGCAVSRFRHIPVAHYCGPSNCM